MFNGHLEDPIRVPDLAAQAGLSTSWFKARFRRETGEGNVTDAAMKFNFSSSQHFATAFKRYNKQSPSQVQPAVKFLTPHSVLYYCLGIKRIRIQVAGSDFFIFPPVVSNYLLHPWKQ